MNTILKNTSLALAGSFCVLGMSAAVGFYVVNVAGDELADSTRLVITSGGIAVAVALGAVALACLAYGVFRAMSAAESWLASRAARRVVEAQAAAAMRDAKVTTITAKIDEQVFVSDDRPQAAPFKPLHLPSGASQFEAVVWADWNRVHSRPAPRIASTPAPAALPAGPGPALLDAIAHLPNLLVVGGKGTGKTTLLQHLTALRAATGKVLIFDSHDFPAKWPAGNVIGNGRAYQNIWAGMVALVGQLQKRYGDYSTGKIKEGQFEPIHNFCDEFTRLPEHFKDQGLNVKQFSIPLLTEGRKVGLNVIWGIHSARAEALGLKGAMDLLECFDAIVYLKNVNGRRFALVDYGEGKGQIEYSLPGAFIVADPDPDWIAELKAGPAPVDPEPVKTDPPKPTDEEMKVIETYVDLRDNEPDRFSYNEVCRRLGWTVGGKQTSRIKSILTRFGIEPA